MSLKTHPSSRTSAQQWSDHSRGASSGARRCCARRSQQNILQTAHALPPSFPPCIQNLGSIPREDLDEEGIRLVEELGFPLTITEDKSVYKPLFQAEVHVDASGAPGHKMAGGEDDDDDDEEEEDDDDDEEDNKPLAERLAAAAAALKGKSTTKSNATSGTAFIRLGPRPGQVEVNKENSQNSNSPNKESSSDKTSASKKRKTHDQSAPQDDKVPDVQLTDPQPCTMIPFDVHGWKTLQFDEGKLELGERVSHYINDKWQIGKISNLSYRGSKWAEYEDMPRVKSHKKGKGLVPPEYSHAFNKDDYGSQWFFVTPTTSENHPPSPVV